MSANPCGSFRGLCLTRRVGEQTRIQHEDALFVLEVAKVEADVVLLALEAPGSSRFSIPLSRRDTVPFILTHCGEELAILVVEGFGTTVKLLFSGPKSFEIQRDDVRNGPKPPLTRLAARMAGKSVALDAC